LVDRQGAALELGAVEGLDGLVTTLGHLDEAEAAGAAGLAVGHDLGPGDGAEAAERLPEGVAGGGERQGADAQVLAHLVVGVPAVWARRKHERETHSRRETARKTQANDSPAPPGVTPPAGPPDRSREAARKQGRGRWLSGNTGSQILEAVRRGPSERTRK